MDYIQLKIKYLKIIIIVIIICITGVFAIVKIFPLQVCLTKNGYDFFDYEIYKTYEYIDCKKIILIAHKSNETFNTIKATIASHKCTFFDEGNPSSKDRNYSTLIYPNGKIWCDDKMSYSYHSCHKLFVIKKRNKEYNFTFDNLPENIDYKMKESEEFYIIEIFDTARNVKTDVYNIDINTLISNIYT